jgi:hypothetical protein
MAELKQIVYFPTTKGDTLLDLICRNLSNVYNEPREPPPLVVATIIWCI